MGKLSMNGPPTAIKVLTAIRTHRNRRGENGMQPLRVAPAKGRHHIEAKRVEPTTGLARHYEEISFSSAAHPRPQGTTVDNTTDPEDPEIAPTLRNEVALLGTMKLNARADYSISLSLHRSPSKT